MKYLGLKQFLLIFALFAPVAMQAQTEACGVEFGSSYDDARKILDRKFGDAREISNGRILSYSDVRYAGYTWDRIEFEFQFDGNASYCIACQMQRTCSDLKTAEKLRDALQAKMADKYEMNEFTDSDGIVYYKGGQSPTDRRDYGFKLHIVKNFNGHLDILADVLNDLLGEPVIDAYAVILTYGPYSYVNEEL